jgi:hypothetical protein
MPDNVDEDLIEATIRRVAEAKAAREQQAEPPADDDADRTPARNRSAKRGPDEDAIEATIRRVQAQKAAAAGATAETPEGEAQSLGVNEETEPDEASASVTHAAAPDEDAIEATIRRVQAQKAAADNAANEAAATDEAELAPGEETQHDDERVSGSPAAAVDEEAIEATIRRVQAQKAAADAALDNTAAAPVAPRVDPDEDAIAATIRRVQAQKHEQELSDEELGISPLPQGGHAETSLAAAIAASEGVFDPDSFEPVSEVSANDDAIARLERALREAHHTIALLTARVEALERTAQREQAQPAQVTAFPARQQSHEDWEDDEPQVAQPAFGPAARPAIMRDPVAAPRTALAEQLSEPELIDTRPLPKPLPPIQVESKRGLDLLPRTYRVTVEDKRRGVDLVPLHRALLSMDGVRDMSLLSYNNGVAIVALETTGDLDSDGLGRFVSRAMSRAAKVEQHNEHTFVVKLAED